MRTHSTNSRRTTSLREIHRPGPCIRSRLSVRASAATIPKQFKKVNPVGERVFVRVQDADVKSAGGLVLPSTAQKAPTQGEITVISEGCSLKIGDHVVYGQYSGTDVMVQGEKHVLLKEADVVGVLDGKDLSKLKPLGDRILVKISKSEEETSAGLLLTAAETEKPTFGTVLNVGPGKAEKDDETATPPNVSIGSTILYSKYSGTEFQGEDETEYIVIRESDVLAELN